MEAPVVNPNISPDVITRDEIDTVRTTLETPKRSYYTADDIAGFTGLSPDRVHRILAGNVSIDFARETGLRDGHMNPYHTSINFSENFRERVRVWGQRFISEITA